MIINSNGFLSYTIQNSGATIKEKNYQATGYKLIPQEDKAARSEYFISTMIAQNLTDTSKLLPSSSKLKLRKTAKQWNTNSMLVECGVDSPALHSSK